MPDYHYSRYDPAQARDAGEAFDQLSDFLLEHGGYVLRQLEHDEALLRHLIAAGYLERADDGGLALTPVALRRVERQALEELFTPGRADSHGQHAATGTGTGSVRFEESRKFEYGDPLTQLNMHATLKQALARAGTQSGRLSVVEGDLVVHESEAETSCCTVLLLDMSGSMARYGKFYHAKKVALALRGLVRDRYRSDTLHVAGFFTFAAPLSEGGLVHAAPKPVHILDSRVFLRVPLEQAGAVPEHFTNIQAGLRFARHLLQKESALNKQIICITDGEPTAHLEENELVLNYPPSERTAQATLEEVRRCVRAGIRLSTLALVEDYFYLDLVNFVDQMARTARGVAVYCKAGELGRHVLESFVSGRRTRHLS